VDLQAFRQRYREQTIVAGGAAWPYVETTGAGPALILLPGAQGTGEMFFKQLAALGGRLRMLALWYPAEPDAAKLADGLASFMDAKGLTRASVLGSSFGGYVAQVFALRHPQRVETLFLANTFADPTPAQAKGRKPDELAALPAEQVKSEVLARGLASPHAELKAVLQDQVGVRQPAENLKARIMGVAIAKPLPPLPVPDQRIVLIECADDPVIGEPMRSALRARHPGAESHALPMGGHYPGVLNGDAYTAIIRNRLLGP
jgi:maspardin